MSSINSMTSITFPMREKKPQQKGDFLLTEIGPTKLSQLMKENEYALSDLMKKSPSWEYYYWNGVYLTSPIMALRGAEKHGLYSYKPVPISKIVNSVNEYLLENGRNTISDYSVLSNLKKAAKYLHTAFGFVMRPDNSTMTVTLLSNSATDKEIEKWYLQMESRLEKIIDLAHHAENSDFKHLPNLQKAKQKFLNLNEALKSLTGGNDE